MRNTAIAVLCLFAFSAGLEAYLYREGQLPKTQLESMKFAHNPEVLIPYSIFLLIGFTFITRAKVKPEHAYLRAGIFGMLFAGLLAMCWVVLFPLI